MAERMRSYSTARKIFSFLEFVGWAVVVIGVIAVLALLQASSGYAPSGIGFMGFMAGMLIALVGLLFVGAVQSWRAQVDSAEYSQQMLKIARDQFEVSKESLKCRETD